MQPTQLKRILGLGFGVAIVIGGALGAGILRMPAIIAGYSGSSLIFISYWIIGGLVALLGSQIYAELGTRFPIAGGPFVMAQKAYGDLGGFVTGWCDWIFNAGAISYLAIASIEYVAKLLQADLPLGIVSSLVIILLAAIQWQGLRLSSNVQKIMSALKAIALLFFVAACFTFFLKGNRYPGISSLGSDNAFSMLPAIILSLRAIFVTYAGWNANVYFIEENTNPVQNLPRSLVFGVLSLMAIYLLVNIGLLTVLPLQVMAKSTLPVADAAQIIFGGSGGTIVTSIAIISLLGALYAILLFTPRILFAISRAGLFFKKASLLNRHSIPGNALLITTCVSVLFALTGLFNLVISITALLGMLVDLSVYVAVVFVRRKNQSGTATYRAWGYPLNAIIMILITLGLIVGLFFEDARNCLYAFIILACAFPFYYLYKKAIKNGKGECIPGGPL